MRKLVICFLLLGAACVAHAQNGTIFLVRHAEKASADRDPDLSTVGRARAECLARTLRDANIKAIFTTELKRTQQTAEPLAKSAGATTKVISAGKSKDAAEEARAASKEGAVLVVGHSNTVPEIARLLGAEVPTGNMADDDYDRLFVVQLNDKATTVTTLHVCIMPPAAK